MSGLENVVIQTTTVSVDTLKIGNRQVTAGIIRQVPPSYGGTHSDRTPFVRYACGLDGKCDLGWSEDHVHYLYLTADGELRRSSLEVVRRELFVGRYARACVRDGMSEDEAEAEAIKAFNRHDQFAALVEAAPYVYAAGAR